jgi:hypothetical protein
MALYEKLITPVTYECKSKKIFLKMVFDDKDLSFNKIEYLNKFIMYVHCA